MIDLSVNAAGRESAARRAKEKGILIPTFAQMRDPSLIPDAVQNRLSGLGLWDIEAPNLFRISWKNEPVERGGGFGPVNVLEFPSERTGVPIWTLQRLFRRFAQHRLSAAGLG